MFNKKEKYRYQAADKAGLTDRTAYKYIKAEKLPSQLKSIHDWQTRKDPFAQDWVKIEEMLKVNPGLEAKTIFEYFQRENLGKYQDGQLRTLQRKIRNWRAIEGPAKEVYFAQVHYPGDLSASDFTRMNSVGIKIQGKAFEHMLYHFVMTYSNWETFTICYSESFESLSAGLQNAFWELGGVPKRHRTDRMSAAVNKDCNPEKFNRNYQGLQRHYGVDPERINARKANENGDVETSHRHFKRAVVQALMLRGSKDFRNIKEYEDFLRKVSEQLNAGRRERFAEEVKELKGLPVMRVNDCKQMSGIKVGKSSTINLQHNVYSVHSRLIGYRISVRIYVNYVEIWYAQKIVESIPRLRGEKKHRINYRHIIEWLVRKPGAFENYRYKEDLYPSSWFRMAYDWLCSNMKGRANKEYVEILYCAAREGEAVTANAIRSLLETSKELSALAVKQRVEKDVKDTSVTEVIVRSNKLSMYDNLLKEEVCCG